MSARKIEQDPPHIAAARARLMDEVCAALPPEAVYRQSPPMTDTPGALEERLRDYAANGSRSWQGIEAVFTEAADEIASLRARVEAMETAARYIKPYLVWTVGPESPGYHPTMPSAVGAFLDTLAPVE